MSCCKACCAEVVLTNQKAFARRRAIKPTSLAKVVVTCTLLGKGLVASQPITLHRSDLWVCKTMSLLTSQTLISSCYNGHAKKSLATSAMHSHEEQRDIQARAKSHRQYRPCTRCGVQAPRSNISWDCVSAHTVFVHVYMETKDVWDLI